MKIDKKELLRNHPVAPYQYCPETGLRLELQQTAFTYDHWWSDACIWNYHPMTGARIGIIAGSYTTTDGVEHPIFETTSPISGGPKPKECCKNTVLGMKDELGKEFEKCFLEGAQKGVELFISKLLASGLVTAEQLDSIIRESNC